MMSSKRIAQHCSVQAMEMDVPSRSDSITQQQQQFLQLQQQHEQLRFLEEQLRLASINMNGHAPCRGLPPKKKKSSLKSRRKNPSVGFCDDVFCYSNPRDYDEIVSSWYSKDELASFKGERKDLIRELKRVDFDLDQIDRNVFHLRGLEPYLSIKYNKYMQKKRASVLQTVLSEQKSQRSRGVKDSESLRLACCEASAWARERAADLGRRDAKVVLPVVVEKNELVLETLPDHAAVKRLSSWGQESDISPPSLCNTSSGSTSTHSSRGSFSTHSSISVASDASMDSLRLQSPSMRKTQQHRVTLERVDELPSLPYTTMET